MVLFTAVVSRDLGTTFRTVFIAVRLVHIQAVNAQLLEGDHIVFSGIVLQLFQFGFKIFPGLFKLFDRESFRPAGFQFIDPFFYLADLF